jgi:Ni/Fe-hydrogenase subunit HybB-like protein
MHQSTLGTMLTILPHRIHPLFYTRLMPLYYFLTAAAAGLAMVVFESNHSARAYLYEFEHKIIADLVRLIPPILLIHLFIRFGELIITGNVYYLFQGGWPTVLFLAEILAGVILPIILFSLPDVRKDRYRLVWSAVLMIGGLILHRFNASLNFLSGDPYLPSLPELLMTFGLTAFGFILYDIAVRFLPILPSPSGTPEPDVEVLE